MVPVVGIEPTMLDFVRIDGLPRRVTGMIWYQVEESNLIRLSHSQECNLYTLPGMIGAATRT